MNAAFIAIGALFIVLGVAGLGRVKAAAPEAVKATRLGAILMMVAGAIFVAAGAVPGD